MFSFLFVMCNQKPYWSYWKFEEQRTLILFNTKNKLNIDYYPIYTILLYNVISFDDCVIHFIFVL